MSKFAVISQCDFKLRDLSKFPSVTEIIKISKFNPKDIVSVNGPVIYQCLKDKSFSDGLNYKYTRSINEVAKFDDHAMASGIVSRIRYGLPSVTPIKHLDHLLSNVHYKLTLRDKSTHYISLAIESIINHKSNE